MTNTDLVFVRILYLVAIDGLQLREAVNKELVEERAIANWVAVDLDDSERR